MRQFYSRAELTTRFRSASCAVFRLLKAARAAGSIAAVATGVYLASAGISWGDPVAVPDNIDSALQKLALHAMQSIPEAQVTGVHSQIAKVNDEDKAQIPGRWDANDRVLVHVYLDGQLAVDEVAKWVQALRGQVLDTLATYGQDVAGTYSGFTAPEYGVGSQAEELGSGGTFTVQFAGAPSGTATGTILNGSPTLGYSPFDGYGLINAVQAVEQITHTALSKN